MEGLYGRIKWILIGILLPLTSYAANSLPTDDGSVYSIFETIRSNEKYLIQLAVATAYILGFFLVVSAIFSAKQVGTGPKGPGSKTMGSVIAKFLSGVALMYLPSTIDTAVQGVFGNNASILSYQIDSSDTFSEILGGAITLVRIIGFVSLIRGIFHLSKVGNGQPGEVGKGVTSIIGGILGINVIGTVHVIGDALGIEILSNL